MTLIPADLLPRLATDEPVEHTIAITARTLVSEQTEDTTDWPITLPAPLSWQLTLDEARRPYATASITWARQALDPARIDPTDTTTRLRLRLEAGYRWPLSGTAASDQLATVVATRLEIDDDAGTVTLEAASDEILLEEDRVGPGLSYQVPLVRGQGLAGIWNGLRSAVTPLWHVRVRSDLAIPDESLEAAAALRIEEGDQPSDLLFALAEACGYYAHSDQSPTSQGGILIEQRREAVDYEATDLSTAADYKVTTRRAVTRDLDDAASHLDLTVTWKDNGEDKKLARRYAARGSAFVRVAAREVAARPPIRGGVPTLPDYYPLAESLLARLQRRTWKETLEARSLYWLRPADAVLVDSGLGLVQSVTYASDTGLMNLTARPY